MSKADEMFKELGYMQSHDGNNNTEYYKYEDGLLANDTLIIIRFYMKDKEVWGNKAISMQELQAINEKVKELRMDIKIREER